MTRFQWTAVSVLVLASNALSDPIPWKANLESERVNFEGTKEKRVVEVTGLAEASNTQLISIDANALKKALTVEGKASGTFQVTGKVRYKGVAGNGYLEMWTYYADGGMYFSRTLADSGPVGKLSGTSDWRDIVLPFHGPAETLPSKVTIGVVLPGMGSVWLEPMTIKPASAPKKSGSWLWLWPLGGIPLLGVMILAMVPRTRGIARPLAITGAVFAGCIVLVTLLLAITHQGQTGITAGAGLIGAIVALLLGAVAFLLRRTTEEELRRMRAMDTAGA